MNILAILLILSLFSGYMMLVFEQTGLQIDIISKLEQSKKRFYELEGLLYYALAYYKLNYKSITFPSKISFTYNNKVALIDFLDKSKKLTKIKVSLLSNNKSSLFCNIYSENEKMFISSIF